MELYIFYIFGALAIFSALSVITRRNPVSSALFLVLCLFSVACLYVGLDAHFLAIIQILLYAGAVVVLFIFIIMLLNLSENELGLKKFGSLKYIAILLGGFFIIEAIAVFKNLTDVETITLSKNFGTVESVGRLLFTDYLLPFEIVSVLLLSAILGAVILGKRKI